MWRIGRTGTGRRWAATLGIGWSICRAIYDAADFIAGKIGWLGVFTSPEDFRTALERAPRWVETMGEWVAPALFVALNLTHTAFASIVSYGGLVAVLLVILVLLLVDVDALKRAASFLRFRVRHIVADRVWIGHDDARKVLRESDWGRIHEPLSYEERTLNRLAELASVLSQTQKIQHGLTEAQKTALRFRVWLDAALRRFAKANPNSVREHEGQPQYDEVKLRDYAIVSLEEEVLDALGTPPSHKVE